MKIFSWNELKSLNDYVFENKAETALTIGGFDGLHKGHISLINRVFDYKQSNEKVLCGAVTFIFNSEFIGMKTEFSGELSTLRQKKQFFEKLGFDFMLIIDFSKDFSKINGSVFLNILKNCCSMQFLAVGSDFRCGHNADTGVAEISDYTKQFGLELAVCEPVLYKNERISSTGIRKSVLQGNITLVNKLLVFPYSLDTSEYEWHFDSSGNQKFLIANRVGFQVFPKTGIYSVRVAGSDKEFISNLYVESDFLRLEVPLEQDSNFLETLTFI
ncbi:MAG: FAD synthetase family protein [Treponemataceae bacterium]